MKIALYGDSFGTSHISTNPNSWYRILARRLDAKLTNYAYGGTSVYWTYNTFLQNYHKYDLNLVLITEPTRYTKKSELPNVQFIPNLSNLEWAKANLSDMTIEQEEFARDLEGWYKVADEEFMQDMAELMIQSMKDKFLNTIVFPCFKTSFTQYRYDSMNMKNNICLYSLYEYQIKSLNIKDSRFAAMQEVRENMCAHLGPELNEFLANVMYEGLVNTKWSFEGLENVKIQNPITFYYEVS